MQNQLKPLCEQLYSVECSKIRSSRSIPERPHRWYCRSLLKMCVAGRNYGGWHVAGGVRSGPLLASRYRLQFKRKLPLLPRHQLVLSKLHLEKIMLATLLKHLHIYPPTATRTIPSIDRHTSPILPPQMRHLARHPALYQTGYSISRCKG